MFFPNFTSLMSRKHRKQTPLTAYRKPENIWWVVWGWADCWFYPSSLLLWAFKTHTHSSSWSTPALSCCFKYEICTKRPRCLFFTCFFGFALETPCCTELRMDKLVLYYSTSDPKGLLQVFRRVFLGEDGSQKIGDVMVIVFGIWWCDMMWYT